jgi:hypothetical protein
MLSVIILAFTLLKNILAFAKEDMSNYELCHEANTSQRKALLYGSIQQF